MQCYVERDTFYNETTNSTLSQMYMREDLQNETDNDEMDDSQLSHLNKSRLLDSMKKLITSSCRKRFKDTLQDIQKSYQQGVY